MVSTHDSWGKCNNPSRSLKSRNLAFMDLKTVLSVEYETILQGADILLEV